MKAIDAGTVINGPDGQGYTVTREIHPGDVLHPNMFEPFGGAPVQRQGDLVCEWLDAFLAGRLDKWLEEYALSRKVT